jgi:hypothetical protein
MIVSIFFWCETSFSFFSSVDFVCFGVNKFFLWARDSFLRCEILLPSPLSFPLNMVHVAYDSRTGDAVPRKGARQTVNREHGDGCVRAGGSINWAAEERIGTLNLVDLGWSDRLASFITTSSSAASTHNGNNNHSNHSPNHGGNAKHTGERRKETQSIRRSPSVLGDAITASGSNRVGQGHVPHQNSKVRCRLAPFILFLLFVHNEDGNMQLTYLPQNSLSENSTTLVRTPWC